MRTLPIAVELAYWTVLISIPYADPLDRILKGGRTKGGSSSGSYGTKLPRHFEDPTSAFSKTTYTFLIPFLLKYYWTPIALEDVPALREDDTSAACLGAFRHFRAERDKAYAARHEGATRKQDLGFDLIRFFLPELTQQAVSPTKMSIELRLTVRYGLLSLSASNISHRTVCDYCFNMSTTVGLIAPNRPTSPTFTLP